MATQTKRATIYFDPDLHKALRLKAAETSRSITELVNEAVEKLSPRVLRTWLHSTRESMRAW